MERSRSQSDLAESLRSDSPRLPPQNILVRSPSSSQNTSRHGTLAPCRQILAISSSGRPPPRHLLVPLLKRLRPCHLLVPLLKAAASSASPRPPPQGDCDLGLRRLRSTGPRPRLRQLGFIVTKVCIQAHDTSSKVRSISPHCTLVPLSVLDSYP